MNFDESSPAESPLTQLAWVGLPLADGLRAAAEDAVFRRDRIAFRQLAARLERGEPVADVLAGTPGLPGEIRELVKEGIATGRLACVLEEYIRSTRETRSIWRSFYASLLYPAVMVWLAGALLLLFIGFAVPMFKEIFDDFGVELPVLTRWLVTLADGLAYLWGLYLLSILAIPGVLLVHRRLPGRGSRSHAFQFLPLIGRPHRMAAAAEFCSRLAVLVDCWIPLDRAFDVLSTSLRDSHLREVSAMLGERLREGTDPVEFARGVPGLLPALSSSFRWARDPELYADGLRSLSELFAAQARVRAGQLGFLAEPAAMFGIAAAAALIAISLTMPLIKLLNELS